MNDKIFSLKFLKDKKTTIFIIIGFIGMVLILFSDSFKKETSHKTDNKFDEQAYINDLEKKVTNILKQIDGVGDCQVMITLETGTEYVYATEVRSNVNTSTDNTYSDKQRIDNQNNKEDKFIIIRDSDGSEKPVLVKKIEPTVKGVAVICDGGDKVYVRQQVVETVMTVLNVPSTRVCVIKKSIN